MFKHILVPTDGSEISKRVVRDCIKFAKEINAEVIGFTAMPEYSVYAYEAEVLLDAMEQFTNQCIANATRNLDDIKAVAKEFGVKCETYYLTSDFPYAAIIQAAQDKNCDLIAMAAHGRKGIKGILLGSETQKVLTHCQIPVLVFR
ncbi:universal stress protein [Solimicrobium silvestre]|uniref:Universal stress protein UspA and related nucleotide-binding protein n=1 Tax=Solimicrobium silvestre TaxID=2099400 RepID=A0A2S9H0I8_9BURK|nr:universal stress protein [Solimicrobium silvestre]PRC93473.1 Universal stress protein UspA and related nucleotide-binding protein [Solimicrobium silvestre]